MTRSLASLEVRAGARLFERSTRRLRLTDAGARYAEHARRVLAELDALDGLAEAEAIPAGRLTLTAPRTAGANVLRPVLHAFLDANPRVQARLLLLDRTVNLVEEGFDAALRIGHLPDSSLVAVRVGEVRHVICAAPDYLAGHPLPADPAALTEHEVISLAETRAESTWTFAGGQAVRLSPRLAMNSISAVRAAALEGRGVARLLSYQVADDVREGRLAILLDRFAAPASPAHLVAPRDRLTMPKTRAFVDFATVKLRDAFEALMLPVRP
jgi:DNA-binding transcriptional LysR family regulator